MSQKSNKQKYFTKQCQKPWKLSFVTNNSRTLFHLEACNYLQINSPIEITFECTCNKRQKFTHNSSNISYISNNYSILKEGISDSSRELSKPSKKTAAAQCDSTFNSLLLKTAAMKYNGTYKSLH